MEQVNHVNYIVDQFIGQNNLDVVDSFFSENYVAYSGDKSYKGYK